MTDAKPIAHVEPGDPRPAFLTLMKKPHRMLVSAIGVAAVLVGISTAASAVADPMLDTTFGSGGKVTTAIGSGTWDMAGAVAIQSDGKIVTAGYKDDDFAVVRYNTDGSPDSSFGVGGKVTTTIGARSYAYAIAIQTDGKILVAGQTVGTHSYDFAVVRYTSAGALDTTFDTDGIVTTDIGVNNSDFDQINGITLQSDGKILVAGYSNSATSYDFAVVRYTSAGALDTTFDTDGIVTTDIGTSSNDYATSVAVQLDGKIVVGGYGNKWGSDDFVLVRYNANGSPDMSFGSSGKVSTIINNTAGDYANGLAIQPDGKIVASGNKCSISNICDVAVARYTTGGTLDTTFDSDGIVTTGLGTSTDDGSYGLVLQSDGKIVTVGYSNIEGSYDIAVFRYTTTGVLDSTFGSSGYVTTDFGGNSSEFGFAVALQSDGKIVAAGRGEVSGSSDFAVVRYLPSSASPTTTADPTTTVAITTTTAAASTGAAGVTTTTTAATTTTATTPTSTTAPTVPTAPVTTVKNATKTTTTTVAKIGLPTTGSNSSSLMIWAAFLIAAGVAFASRRRLTD